MFRNHDGIHNWRIYRKIQNTLVKLKYIKIIILGTAFFLTNLANSFALEFHNENVDLKFRPGFGFRMDDLKWSIADKDGHPNILSELEFNDLFILQTGIDFNLLIHELYFRSTLNYGEIIDGMVTDSDYALDNRNGLFSRSESEINNDSVQNISLGFGYQLYLRNKGVTITPLFGFSQHTQNLRITNGVQTFPDLATIPGLNSTYQSKWSGAWLGMDILLKPAGRFSLASSLEYHKADYWAKANWNLRDDFAHPVSFTHKAKGNGIVIKAGINIILDKRWNAGLTSIWQDWWTDSGIDQVYFSTGNKDTTKLNAVNWESKSINFFFSYDF